MADPIVLVGGGVAAANFCSTLRTLGCRAPVTLVSLEERAPYERPALTKTYLTGAKTIDQIALLSLQRLSELEIDLRLGVGVLGIDANGKALQLSDGSMLAYGSLVLCTGLTPRRILPKEIRSRVHIVRTFRDADALKADLARASRIAILGGGWLGLECAAHLLLMGKEVTVIDTAATLCARNATVEISELLAQRHRERGTRFLLSSSPVSATLSDTGVQIEFADGEGLDVDLIVEAIGATSIPISSGGRVAWTAAGVPVDHHLRTAVPDVYAMGDMAIVVPDETGVATRFETWANAVAQGQFLARRLAGSDERFKPDTWFWSDQGSDNFQMVGFPQIADQVERVIDEPERKFWRYLKRDELVGAAAFNEFKQIKLAKRQVTSRATAVT